MLRGSRRWISFENICISVRIAASNGRGSPSPDAIKNGKRCRIVPRVSARTLSRFRAMIEAASSTSAGRHPGPSQGCDADGCDSTHRSAAATSSPAATS